MRGGARARPPTPSRMNGAISKKAGSWTEFPGGGAQASNGGRLRRGSVDESRGGAAAFHAEEVGRRASDEVRSRGPRGDPEGSNVKVFIRTRPPNEMELADEDAERCVVVTSSQTCNLRVEAKEQLCNFAFDRVFDEDTTQHQMCEVTGVPLVDNCMSGYNSTIFAYGQTGAGKTHTMVGNLEDRELRGLAPRVLEMLFDRMHHEEQQGARFSVECTFLEIHNETITDLLEPSVTNMQIREGQMSGAYVEGLKAVKVSSASVALGLMKKGTHNRRVAETKSNRRSSRSHMVFTCVVEKTVSMESGVEKKTYSRLNLVDLAGSERNRVSGAKSDTLKEACHINKSLSTLGRVIRGLVDSQKLGHGHIPYRDSKLTYLLQESLGGNAKTSIIANISPMSPNAQETLSTLLFVKSAKDIRQRFKVNEATNHHAEAMQKELFRLKVEMDNLRVQVTEPALKENALLKERLNAEEQKFMDLQDRFSESVSMAEVYKVQLFEVQEEVRDLKDTKCSLRENLDDLLEQCEQLRIACSDVDALRERASTAEINAVKRELEVQKEKTKQAETEKGEKAQLAESFEVKVSNMAMELQMLHKREQDLLTDIEAAHSSVSKLQQEVETLTEDLDASRTAHDELQQREAHLTEELATTKGSLEKYEEELKETQSELERANTQVSLKTQEVELLHEKVSKSQKDLKETKDSLAASQTEAGESEQCIKLLREKLDTQDSKLWGTEEAVAKLQKTSIEKDAEVVGLKEEIKVLRQQLEEKKEKCRNLEEKNINLESRLTSSMEQNTEAAKVAMELQSHLVAYPPPHVLDEQCMEIEDLQRMYKEASERANDAEHRLEQMTAELERLFQYNFQYTSYFDTIESLLDDVEADCPEDIMKKLEEYEKRGDCDRSLKKHSTKRSSRRSERSTPVTPPAAAMRYGVLGQIPGGFPAYCNMAAPPQRTLSKHGSMSAREGVWRGGFL